MSKASSYASLKPLCLDGSEEALVEDIIICHDNLVKSSGYNPELSDDAIQEIRERLLSVIISSFCTIYGSAPEDRYSDPFKQIAVFASYLANDHIFPDGNKRTTVVFTLSILYIQGIDIHIRDIDDPMNNELYFWIQDVVTGESGLDDLADLLRTHSVIPES